MATLNRVLMIGNLTKDPALRYTPGGAAVADLRLAVNTTYVNKAGEKTEEVCYVDVVTWGRQAETAAEYTSKGSPVFVEGRLQLDTWETSSGEKRSKLRIRAQRVQFLGRPKGAAPRETSDVEEPPLVAEESGGKLDEDPDAPQNVNSDVPF